jgi:hypothetical protein
MLPCVMARMAMATATATAKDLLHCMAVSLSLFLLFVYCQQPPLTPVSAAVAAVNHQLPVLLALLQHLVHCLSSLQSRPLSPLLSVHLSVLALFASTTNKCPKERKKKIRVVDKYKQACPSLVKHLSCSENRDPALTSLNGTPQK